MLTQTLHEQPDLFATDRWPRRPYCSDDLQFGLKIRSLSQALTKSYIQVNPPRLRVWSMFDIDRAGAAVAWEDADLPPPSWITQNRENGHAHLVYGLSVPVLVDGLGARDAPLRYLSGIESMMRAKLRADEGFSGLITKNPLHPLWRTLRGPTMGYELGELAQWLPGLEKHIVRRNPEENGLGRNLTVFDETRAWAYRAIRPYWGTGLQGWNCWLAACNGYALGRNGEFPSPMDPLEVWHIAKSVAKWTWRNTTFQSFSAYQAAQGAKGGRAKAKAYEDRAASARVMRASGLTQAAIAAELGVTERTIRNWTGK